MQISDKPDSKNPYYISTDGMEQYFFNVVYENGHSFSQYEQTPDGRLIAHHWHEVYEHNVRKLEVWESIRDDGVFTTVLVMEVSIPVGSTPVFKYHNVVKMPSQVKERSCVFGCDKHLWKIDAKGKIGEYHEEGT